ncbi:Hypothetical_protein [Hexamita inflata]|uniref:Hypothetical_protein n=1 Tax=Hexamita inflata TaxID=28002 RepID=A0AA86NY01_9EUKA|nr:Hypothetical protein HINF_LOCUS14439 [Hexamita inflata]
MVILLKRGRKRLIEYFKNSCGQDNRSLQNFKIDRMDHSSLKAMKVYTSELSGSGTFASWYCTCHASCFQVIIYFSKLSWLLASRSSSLRTWLQKWLRIWLQERPGRCGSMRLKFLPKRVASWTKSCSSRSVHLFLLDAVILWRGGNSDGSQLRENK